jgi:RHS repeat-associated protein
MSALARNHVTDAFTPAANDDCINGGSCNRTKYSYDANGNAITRQGSSISWSSYNYPTTINAGSGSTAETVAFSYGPERQRWQQMYTGNSTQETTNYIGGLLEVVASGSVTDYRHYIQVAGEQIAVYSRKSSGTNTFSYLLSDHQASVASITNSGGTQIVGESFDAFGSRRSPSTWSGAPSNSDLTTIAGVTREGYTFQTALGLWMGMNHMNGRVEDSITGRMLSGDPMLPYPAFAQSYNRYSYTHNNPLTYTDPSGFEENTCASSPGTCKANNPPGAPPTSGAFGDVNYFADQQSNWTANGYAPGTNGNDASGADRNYWSPTNTPGGATECASAMAGGYWCANTTQPPSLPTSLRLVYVSGTTGLSGGGANAANGTPQGTQNRIPSGFQKNAAFNQCMADRVGALGFALDQFASLFGADSNLQQAFSQGVYDIEAGGAANMIAGYVLASGRLGLGGGSVPNGMLWGSRIGGTLFGATGGEIGATLGLGASTATAISGAFAGGYLAATAAICFAQTQ